MKPQRAQYQRRKLLHFLCIRCERPIMSSRIERECFLCLKAGVKVYGSAHPRMEMGAA